MTLVTRTPLHAVGLGLALGIMADSLLFAEPWGLNLFVCVAALVAAGYALIRLSDATPSPDVSWLALTALLLAAAFMRRDAEFLQGLDFLALIGVSALAALAARGVTIRGKRIGAYVVAFFTSARDAVIGGPLALRDVSWHELPFRSRLGSVSGIAVGFAIAIPLLFLFGALFAGADPVFSRTMSGVFDIDLGEAMAHTVRTVVLGSFAAGYLRGLVTGVPLVRFPRPLPSQPARDRVVPTVTALLLVDALFLLFVVIQLRYFFGGAARVQEVGGLTYAAYARKGFFELVWVCVLVVPLLLAAEWAVRAAGPVPLRRFRLAAGGLLALVGVVVVSALERMRLYVDAYGLTVDRFYATAAIVYCVVVLAWLGWTVLRGQGHRFAFGAVIQALAVLGGLHVLNPDAFIVRHNLARPGAEQPFDVAYASSLGADVAPVLLDALPNLTSGDACVAARWLAAWAATDTDWRTWNWSRARAARIGSHSRIAAILAACAPVPDSNPPSR